MSEQDYTSTPRISIAMATYNGERYLEEELDSIRAQSLPPFELVVSDDCSSDRTVDIVRHFADTAGFPVRIYRNETNFGFGGNFFRAARECRGDWIAFCDQDDVWLPNKLSDCATAIGHTPELSMVLQKAKLCNERLGWGGRIIPNNIRAGVYEPRRQNIFWVWFGFLQTISRELLSLYAPDLPMSYCRGVDLLTHDGWACTVANAVGRIAVIDEPAALYRRHDAALTGYHGELSASDRVELSRQVGAVHYQYMSDAATSNAHYLRRASAGTERQDWRKGIDAVARDFERMAAIQQRRADLYRSSSALSRFRNHASIWRLGGYLGSRRVALGLKSAVKDVVQVLSRRWSANG